MRDPQRELQDLTKARSNTPIPCAYLDLVEKSRNAVARLLRVSMDEVVFVLNATKYLSEKMFEK